MIFKPWNKDIEQLFMRISRNGKAYIDNNFENTTRILGRDNSFKEYFEIFWNNEKRKSVVLPMDDVIVVPKPINRRSKTRLFEVYRLF